MNKYSDIEIRIILIGLAAAAITYMAINAHKPKEKPLPPPPPKHLCTEHIFVAKKENKEATIEYLGQREVNADSSSIKEYGKTIVITICK